MTDLNNHTYLKKLGDAANSEEGMLIIEFLKNEESKLKYEDIDLDLPPDQLAIEFKKMRAVKEFINTKLKILLNN